MADLLELSLPGNTTAPDDAGLSLEQAVESVESTVAQTVTTTVETASSGVLRIMQLLQMQWIVAGLFVLIATALSVRLTYKHFQHYNAPQFQKHIVRIVWMVPLYSLESWFSICVPSWSVLFDAIRDVYEAYVIYTFLSLLIEYLGGEVNLGNTLELKRRFRHPWPLHSLQPIKPGRRFLRRMKQGTLQYCFVKPATASVAVALNILGLYDEGHFEWKKGYLYVSTINNISITISLYSLVLFYVATTEELAHFRPVAKFLCVKAVVFFSYWQSVGIAVLVMMGIIHDVPGYFNAHTLAVSLQDFAICFEMVLASFAHSIAFTYRDFEGKGVARVPLLENFRHVANIKDVLRDARNTFNPPRTDFEMREGMTSADISSSDDEEPPTQPLL